MAKLSIAKALLFIVAALGCMSDAFAETAEEFVARCKEEVDEQIPAFVEVACAGMIAKCFPSVAEEREVFDGIRPSTIEELDEMDSDSLETKLLIPALQTSCNVYAKTECQSVNMSIDEESDCFEFYSKSVFDEVAKEPSVCEDEEVYGYQYFKEFVETICPSD